MVNMTAPCWYKMQKTEGDLEDGGLLGGMMVGVDGTAGVDRTVGTRVVLKSSP